VNKFRANVTDGAGLRAGSAAESEPQTEPLSSATGEPDVATTVATIGVIGVAAALFDVALIPGIIIGVAAAYAPKYVTNLGERLQPLFDYTVRGAYKVTRSVRSAAAEAQERMNDIAAEVEAEEAATEGHGEAPARAAP
jgi:hypothetical protein